MTLLKYSIPSQLFLHDAHPWKKSTLKRNFVIKKFLTFEIFKILLRNFEMFFVDNTMMICIKYFLHKTKNRFNQFLCNFLTKWFSTLWYFLFLASTRFIHQLNTIKMCEMAPKLICLSVCVCKCVFVCTLSSLASSQKKVWACKYTNLKRIKREIVIRAVIINR